MDIAPILAFAAFFVAFVLILAVLTIIFLLFDKHEMKRKLKELATLETANERTGKQLTEFRAKRPTTYYVTFCDGKMTLQAVNAYEYGGYLWFVNERDEDIACIHQGHMPYFKTDRGKKDAEVSETLFRT